MSASKLLRAKRTTGRIGKPRHVLLMGPLVAASLLLAACGKSDTAADVPPSDSAASTSTSYFGPLEEYMNPRGAGEQLDQEDYEAKDRQVQELVATCMKDQGFDYLPTDNSAQAVSFGGSEGLSERDTIAKYGYWVTAVLEMQPDPTEVPTDPNQAAYEAMSDGERMAYDMALWGTGAGMMSSTSASAAPTAGSGMSSSEAPSTDAPSTEAPSTEAPSTEAPSTDAPSTDAPATDAPVSIAEGEIAPESYAIPTTPEELGCYGVAQQEIYGDQMSGGGMNYEDFQDLFDAQSELYTSIDKDPRLAQAVTAWAVCLEGKGYPGFTEMQAPIIDVNKKWAELNNQVFTVTEDGGWNTEPKPGAENDPPVVPDAAKVAELKKYEIDLALADFDCKGDYQKLWDEARIALEEQFVLDHKAELERYRDAINSGGN